MILTWISKGMYQDTDVLESVVVDMILRSEEQLSREVKKLAADN